MIIGESLIAGTTTYSPWFEASGDAATFAVEIMGIVATGFEDPGGNVISQLVVNVETKKGDSPDGDASTLSGAIITSALGEAAVRFSGFSELLRFRYEVQLGTYSFYVMHLRMLPPLWQCNQLQESLEGALEPSVQHLFPVN